MVKSQSHDLKYMGNGSVTYTGVPSPRWHLSNARLLPICAHAEIRGQLASPQLQVLAIWRKL